jgi:hypothetical protein
MLDNLFRLKPFARPERLQRFDPPIRELRTRTTEIYGLGEMRFQVATAGFPGQLKPPGQRWS